VVQSAAAKGAVIAPPKAMNAPVAAAPPAATPAKPGAGAPAAPAAPKPVAQPAPSTPAGPGRLEAIAEQLLVELRRRNEQGVTDFSVSKLLGGVTQILVLATMFLGYVRASNNQGTLQIYLLVALILQTMTIALLIMSRQR
jgi:hypothetical protein